MRKPSGFTIIETVVSMILMGTMMTTLLSSYSLSQRSFFTSESYLNANQSQRSAIEAVRGDLANSQIVSYYNNVGSGKVYVKFHRLSASGIPVNQNGDPNWDSTFWMYLWCKNGSTPASGNLCDPNITGVQSRPGQLLLISSASGSILAPWQLARVLTENLQSRGSLAGQDPNDDANGGFRVVVFKTDGTQLEQADFNVSNGEFIRPFGAASTLVADWPRTQWPNRVTVTIRTRASALGVLPIRSQSTSEIKLRDYQGDCGGPCPVNM